MGFKVGKKFHNFHKWTPLGVHDALNRKLGLPTLFDPDKKKAATTQQFAQNYMQDPNAMSSAYGTAMMQFLGAFAGSYAALSSMNHACGGFSSMSPCAQINITNITAYNQAAYIRGGY